MGAIEDLRRRQRERALSGDERAGIWSRNQVRRQQYAFLRKQWRVWAGFIALIIALVVGLVVWSEAPRLEGALIGAAIVGVPGMIWHLTVLSTGTGNMLMGESGEQMTADELRTMRRTGWKLVNHVVLKISDIDHVLVGPGGAFAVETKWSSRPWGDPVTDPRVRAATAQARENARLLRLWEVMRRDDVDVTPMVIVWGPVREGLSSWEAPLVSDGVLVLHGRALKSWRKGLASDVLTDEVVTHVWEGLDHQARVRDDALSPDERPPRSVGDVLQPLGMGIGTSGLSLVGLVKFWELAGEVWLQTLVPVVVVAVTASLLHLRVARAAGWGVIVGVGLPTVAYALANLWQTLLT